MSIYSNFNFPMLDNTKIQNILTQYIYFDAFWDFLLNEKINYVIKYFEAIVDEFGDKTNNEIINLLGTFYSYDHKPEKSHFYHLLGAKNNNPHSYECLGWMCENKEDIENAIKYYELAVKYGSLYAYELLANIYDNNNNKDLANFYRKKAFDNEYIPEMYNVALELYIAKKYNEAIIIYEKILVICDKFTDPYENFNIRKNTIKNLINIYRLYLHDEINAKKYYLMYINNIGKDIAFEYAKYLWLLDDSNEEIIKYCEIMKIYVKKYWCFSKRKIKKINKFIKKLIL